MKAKKSSSLVDVSVLLLFHARFNYFSKVWAEVSKARPARLFLYQDGPRMINSQGQPVVDVKESKDWLGIQACRELVSDEKIDWDCEVHRNYRKTNAGCDPSGFNSQRWAFSLTDKCIVLEDDVVPSQSFFPFCREMLDKYESDERITMVAGFNTDAITPTDEINGTSYFFTRAFSPTGCWASWSRVVNNWDETYSFVKDPKQIEVLREKVMRYHQRRDLIKLCQQHAKTGTHYFETIFWAYMMLNDGLAIMPSINQFNNIGMSGGTHYDTRIELLPKRLRSQFTMPRYELAFPIVYPMEVREHPAYQQRYYLKNAWNNPWRKVQYSFEELWLNLKVGNFQHIGRSIIRRLRKMIQ